MGAARDVALNELNFRGISINADEAGQAITVVPSDSGVIFINKEDEGTVVYTLPAVALGKGKWFWFYEGVATEIKIKGTTACIVGDATDQYATGDAYIGACAFVIGDGTYYYLHEIYGGWAVASS